MRGGALLFGAAVLLGMARADTVQFSIGRKTPVQDGCVTRAEYGAFVPYMYEIDGTVKSDDLPYAARSPESYFAWDDTFLYMAMVSACAHPKAKVSERDGPVYCDDSVDFYVSHNWSKGALHHFIFNPLGTVYDARRGDKTWNAEGLRVFSHVTNGLWILEVAVPWRNFDFTPRSAVFAPHVNLCRTYRSGQGSSVKFIDLDENYSVALAHGAYAEQARHALAFLVDEVPALAFPALVPPGPGENARRQTVSLRDPKDAKKVVFWGCYPLLPHDPVTFRSVSTDMPSETLLFFTENNFPAAEDYAITLDFRDRKAPGESVLTLTGPAAKQRGLACQRFSVKALPEGEYKLCYRVTDTSGKPVAEDFTYYGRYGAHPPWENCPAGAEDVVPPPWPKPVFREREFACWGRTVAFGGEGMIASCRSQGRELLAGPVRLVQDGRPVPLAVRSADRHVSWADYLLESATLPKVTVKIRAEFDGYLWCDVTRAAGAYRSLTVEIPLARAFVRGFDDGHAVVEKLALGPGVEGRWTFDPRERPFLWIGDGATGMMVGTEDRRGWSIADPRKGYALDVTAREAKVTVNFVTAPVAADRPVTVGFYLNPTPVRPKNIALEQVDAMKMCRWTGSVAEFCDMKMPGAMNEAKIARYKARQAKGEKVFWYGGSAIASPYAPVWAWYGGEWNFTGDPGTVYLEVDPRDRARRDAAGWIWGCLRNKSFFDFRLWSHAWFLNHPDYGVSNLYFDISFPRPCRNRAHGCDNEYFFRGMREMHKRIYRELKRKNPEGAMLGHVRFVRSPADNFFDESWCGEAYEIEVARQHNYYGLLAPEAMQVHYASRAADMVMGISCQIYRTYQVYHPDELKAYDPEDAESLRAILHAAAYFKIHNLIITVRPDESGVVGSGWWRAESAAHFLGPDRKFSAYYLPDCPVTVEKPERLFLHALSWNARGEALLILLNDTDRTVTKRLSIDKARIGGPLFAGEDIFTREKCDIHKESFAVTLGPRAARFFAFRKEQEK